MFCEMSPVIEKSIVQIHPNRWLMGSSVVCEIVPHLPPKDILKAWKDTNGQTYCLRKLSGGEIWDESGCSETGLVHKGGTSACIWRIGTKFVKVKAWRVEMQLECENIRFADKKNSTTEVIIPKVVHSWVDVQWNRTFLILEPLEGRTLHKAWNILSPDQQLQIACKVAQFCRNLARSTSQRLEAVGGRGVYEPFLTQKPPDAEPSWKPWLLGPYGAAEIQNHLSSSVENWREPLYFYHPDLGPENIIVMDSGDIGILDWESAGFYPKFWIGTKPLVSAGFYLPKATDRKAWSRLLAAALNNEGFTSDMDKYHEWKIAIGK